MADPILHIKDSYYFELPKVLWPAKYKSLDELPSHLDFLKQDAVAHHATIDDVNKELSGKIVIPQPLGKLKSFYAAESGFCISKFMVLEFVIAALMIVVFTRLAPKIGSGKAPKGFVWNFFEAFLLFIRDAIARPAIDSHDDHGHDDHGHDDHGHDDHGHDDHGQDGHAHGHAHGHEKKSHAPKHEGDRFLPILWTVFFFVLFCNLFGMLPWLGAPSGSFSVTLALAVCIFGTSVISGSMKFGPVGFWKNQIPSMELSPAVAILLKPMIFAIEVMGLVIKHSVLAVRLLANMVAGHLVLLSVLGLIVAAAGASTGMFTTIAGASIIGSTLLSCLELFVAFLQAYVFTFLSALFIGAASHHH